MSLHKPSVLLNVFPSAYQAVDVRVAMIKDHEAWLLVAMTVHIRVASVEATKKEFTELIKRFGSVDSPVFRIFQKCYSLTEAEFLFRDIASGVIDIDGTKITLTDKFDILSTNCNVKNNNFDNHGCHWPCMESYREVARNNSTSNLLYNDFEIPRVAVNAGYPDAHAAVGTLLDIEFNASSNSPGRIFIACDIPVRLLPLEVMKTGGTLHLTFKAESHSVIKDLSFNVYSSDGSRADGKQQARVRLAEGSRVNEMVIWHGEADFLLDRNDLLTMDVVSQAIGKLYYINVRPFDHLPPEQRNPLLAALQLFCSEEQMALLLGDPNKATVGSSSGHRAQRLFETSIQWLLSVLGFYAVCLQGYEKLKDVGTEGTVREYGTVDCLAYSEEQDLLLLAHCSLGPPNPNEISKYLDLAAQISNRLYSDGRVKVRSALFTGAYKQSIAQQGSHWSGIKIFCREDIEQLLQTAKSGHKLEHLRLLMFSQFRD